MSSAHIIDGKKIAANLRARIAVEVLAFIKRTDRAPGLAAILVGEDQASQIYVRAKHKATLEAHMESFAYKMEADTTQADLVDLVKQLNSDDRVDGILVQLPLPAHIEDSVVIAAIDPAKDVDGFHVVNAGHLAIGKKALVPCTPLGCLMLLRDQIGDLTGLEAVILGRSNIVGKPMAQLLLDADCTVTVAHSKTVNPADIVRRADIVVAAVGRPEIVKGDWIKKGAVVIDVGINRIAASKPGKTRLVGDVAISETRDHVKAITPVPGGVGPMTIAMLLRNTLFAAQARAGILHNG